jgi:hypothetical protein
MLQTDTNILEEYTTSNFTVGCIHSAMEHGPRDPKMKVKKIKRHPISANGKDRQ